MQNTHPILKPRLTVYTGTMFSGKTSGLSNEIERFQRAGFETLVFSPEDDIVDSYDTIKETHNGVKISVIKTPTNDLSIIKNALESDIPVIGIDEAQFFGEELIRLCKLAVNYKNKVVIVSGLDMDCFGLPFGIMPDLMAIADDVYKKKAVCKECGMDANFEYRLNKENLDTVAVGGQDDYIPLCRSCFNKKQIYDGKGYMLCTTKRELEEVTFVVLNGNQLIESYKAIEINEEAFLNDLILKYPNARLTLVRSNKIFNVDAIAEVE